MALAGIQILVNPLYKPLFFFMATALTAMTLSVWHPTLPKAFLMPNSSALTPPNLVRQGLDANGSHSKATTQI
jgi:hypothetical protein